MKSVAIVGNEKHLKNYIDMVNTLELKPVVTTDPAVAAQCDSLMLPGGGDIDPALYNEEDQGSVYIDRATDEAQLEALARFVQAKRPVFGICKGQQIINVFFGGKIIQDLPNAASHKILGKNIDNLHRINNIENTPMFYVFGPYAKVNSAHHQAVGSLGEHLYVSAIAPDNTIEGLIHETLPIMSVQFHPERMCFANKCAYADDAALLMHFFKGMVTICPDIILLKK